METDDYRRSCKYFRIEGYSTISGENCSCLRDPGWVIPLRGGECEGCPHFKGATDE